MKRFSLFLLGIGAFVMGTAELVIAGILPVISSDLNITLGTAGQLISAFSLAFAIGTPIIVSLTAKISRKSLLIGALAGFAIGSLMAVFAANFPLALVSRVLLGLSAGIFSVVGFGAAAKLVPPEQTGRAVGMLTLGISVSNVIGVPAGVLLADWWNWRAIFILLGVLTVVILIAMPRFFPSIEGDAPVAFKRQFAVFRNPVIASGLLISVFFSMSFSMMNTYLVPFAETVLDMRTALMGPLLLGIGVCGIIGSRVGGIGSDRWGSTRIIPAGLIVSAAALAAVPVFRHSTAAAIALLALWTLVMSAVIPAILTHFIKLAPESANLVLGLNTSVLHLGVALGSGIGGAIVNRASTVLYHPVISGSILVLSLLGALFSFVLGKKSALPSPTAPSEYS